MEKSQGKPYFFTVGCDPQSGEHLTYEVALEAAKTEIDQDGYDSVFVYEAVPRSFVTKAPHTVELITNAPTPKKRGRPGKKK